MNKFLFVSSMNKNHKHCLIWSRGRGTGNRNQFYFDFDRVDFLLGFVCFLFFFFYPRQLAKQKTKETNLPPRQVM